MIVKKYLGILIVLLSFSGCATANSPVRTSTQAIHEASVAVVKYDLASNQRCIVYEATDKGSYYLVRVRKSNAKECGGISAIEPTLFFMKIIKHNGKILTTAYNVDGSLEPLSHQKKSLLER